jgi:hypothetical protein
MPGPDERPGQRDENREDRQDREAIDRAFADLVAGYHLTADRPEPPEPAVATEPAPTEAPKLGWADDHPLFRYDPEPEPAPEPAPEERYLPPSPEPLPKPAWPVLLAWIGMGYAVLTMLAVVVGVRLPSWAGWLAIIGFVGGFGILVTRLPRNRPPEAGDGAVL